MCNSASLSPQHKLGGFAEGLLMPACLLSKVSAFYQVLIAFWQREKIKEPLRSQMGHLEENYKEKSSRNKVTGWKKSTLPSW